MPTIHSAFIRALISGAPQLLAVESSGVGPVPIVTALGGIRVDLLDADLSKADYAKNGSFRVALSGATPVTIDLTNTTAAAQSYAGDTSFAGWSQLNFLNDGTEPVTVTPGSSNPATLPFTSLTLEPGDQPVFTPGAPVAITSGAKNVTVTPTAGGSLIVSIGGQ